MVIPDSLEKNEEFAGKFMKYGISIVEYSRTLSEPSPRYLHVHTLFYAYMLQSKARQHKGSTQGNQPISKQKKLSFQEQSMNPQPLAFMAGALITIPPSRLQTCMYKPAI